MGLLADKVTRTVNNNDSALHYLNIMLTPNSLVKNSNSALHANINKKHFGICLEYDVPRPGVSTLLSTVPSRYNWCPMIVEPEAIQRGGLKFSLLYLVLYIIVTMISIITSIDVVIIDTIIISSTEPLSSSLLLVTYHEWSLYLQQHLMRFCVPVGLRSTGHDRHMCRPPYGLTTCSTKEMKVENKVESRKSLFCQTPQVSRELMSIHSQTLEPSPSPCQRHSSQLLGLTIKLLGQQTIIPWFCFLDNQGMFNDPIKDSWRQYWLLIVNI